MRHSASMTKQAVFESDREVGNPLLSLLLLHIIPLWGIETFDIPFKASLIKLLNKLSRIAMLWGPFYVTVMMKSSYVFQRCVQDPGGPGWEVRPVFPAVLQLSGWIHRRLRLWLAVDIGHRGREPSAGYIRGFHGQGTAVVQWHLIMRPGMS